MSEIDDIEIVLTEVVVTLIKAMEEIDLDAVPAPLSRVLKTIYSYGVTGVGLIEMLRDDELKIETPFPQPRDRLFFIGLGDFAGGRIKIRDQEMRTVTMPTDKGNVTLVLPNRAGALRLLKVFADTDDEEGEDGVDLGE